MSEEQPPPRTPAGWYPVPTHPNSERYWDGEKWTDQTRSMDSKSTSTDRPVVASSLTDRPVPSAGLPAIPPATGMGCCGPILLAALGIVAVIIVISFITAIAQSQSEGSNESSSTGTSANSSTGTEPDAIEQARVVLSQNYGESFSHSELESVTDAALLATGEAVTEDTRSRAWSAV